MADKTVDMISGALRRQRESAPRTVEGIRQHFGKMMALFPADPTVTREAVDAGGVPGEWFTPAEYTADRVLFYLHGGGYVIGSPQTHAALISDVAKACRARCLAIDYRLAPEHKHPAQVEDALAAYRWLLAQGHDPAQMIVAGDSAGGGLTLALLLAARDAALPLPAAAVCLSPWTDLAATGESLDTRGHLDPMLDKRGVITFARMLLHETDATHPLVSPLYGDLTGLPPLLIHVGGAEILHDDSTRLAERAKEAGVDVTLEIWDEMMHVFHFYGSMLEESREAIQKIGHFADARLGR